MFFAVNTPDIPVRVQAIGITIPEKFELDGDPVDRIYSEGCASDCSDSDSGSDSSKKKTDIMLKSKKSPLAPPPEGAPSSEIIAESGYLRGHLRIDGDMVKKWHAASDHSNDRTLLKLQAFFAGEPETPNSGVVNLISPHGISVISDIDDTIKMTGILQGVKTVLGNTFFKKTNDVPGMADVYNEWYRKGVAFHYVSNGPWQLYPMLDQFFRDHRFPPGAAHLRMYDGISAVLQDQPGQTKQDRIIDIFNDFPHRRFILVGDSGEKDPEVYAEIARRFPDRVVCIFIHDVTTPMLLEQVQAKLETTIHDGNNNAKTTKEAKSGAETKHETSNEAESFRQRIHNRLSEIKCQFHEDIHESSETVGDMFDWVDNKTDSMQDELSIKVDELAQSTRKAMQEFRQRIHDVFDGLKDWRLFMEAREMLSHEKLHSVFDKPSIAQVEAQELSVRADPLQ
jgi:phosphatidate phosphatase APP1